MNAEERVAVPRLRASDKRPNTACQQGIAARAEPIRRTCTALKRGREQNTPRSCTLRLAELRGGHVVQEPVRVPGAQIPGRHSPKELKKLS